MPSTDREQEYATVRRALNAEREATSARIQAMTSDFGEIVEGSTGSNTDDEHDPEGSTIAFERAQVSALLTEARASLADLDQALARLAHGTHGTCARCGRVIPWQRLEARPATRTCVPCAGAGPGSHTLNPLAGP